ncbi:MAG: radical SAM protein [Clostridia bacterium]|nr:radical SAM protein [Clostridia bacterium]
MRICNDCPRLCGVDRTKQKGYCGCSDDITVALITLHRFEEPIISGKGGSGAVFFGGCNLKCVYCQNGAISVEQSGKVYSEEELVSAMLKLQNDGADNINLITATHFISSVQKALKMVKPQLKIPVIYNCGGYESVNSLKMLDGLVDVYLPDFKYYDDELALKYSFAPHYRETALSAIKEMCRQQSETVIENGLIKKGVVIRHLVLPSHRQDSMRVIDLIADNFPTVKVSIMRQYTPAFNRSTYKNLDRRITSFEYDSVVARAIERRLDGYIQQSGCENEKFTPDFIKFMR